jgi:hypothetical protein
MRCRLFHRTVEEIHPGSIAGSRFRLRALWRWGAGLALRDFEADPFDVILLAPQTRFMRNVIATKVVPYGTVVQPLDPEAFGMHDGEKLLQQIREALATGSAGSSPVDI